MNAMKKCLALILAVCMLIGMPLCMDVAAVGTGAEGEVIPQVVAVQASTTWAAGGGKDWDHTLFLYFTENMAKLAVDTTQLTAVMTLAKGREGALNMDAIQGIQPYVQGSIISLGGTRYAFTWSASGLNFNGKFKDGYDTEGLFDGNIDTVEEWYRLAELNNSTLVVRIFDKAAYNGSAENADYASNGKVEGLAIDGQAMTADLTTCKYHGNLYGIADAISAEVVTRENAAYMETAVFDRQTGKLSIGFSGNITQRFVSNTNPVIVEVGVFNASYQRMGYNETEEFKLFSELKAKYPDDASIAGNGQNFVYHNITLSAENYMNNVCTFTVSKSLGDLIAKVQVYNVGKAASEKVQVLCRIKEQTIDATKGEAAGNTIIDGIWSSGTYAPMLANKYFTNNDDPLLGAGDVAYCKVLTEAELAGSLNGSNTVSLTGVKLGDDNTVVLSFSEPVLGVDKLGANAYMVLVKNTSYAVYGGAATLKDMTPYTVDHKTWIGKISGIHSAIDTAQERADLVASGTYAGYSFALGITDGAVATSSTGDNMTNGVVDRVTSYDGAKKLWANVNRTAGTAPNKATTQFALATITEMEKSVMTEGVAYSFMNADTGRELAVGNVTEFEAVSAGAADVWYLKSEEQYLDLTGDKAALSDEAIAYSIKNISNDRYQILHDTSVILDTDEGQDATVTLGHEQNTYNINSGWYVTASGEEKPLRILPIGDSITDGDANPDNKTHKFGWRDDLSEILNTKLDRYVFVGSQVTQKMSVSDTTLARHEGHSGATIADLYAAGLTTNQRPVLMDYAPTTAAKYAPDVVLLMVGVNDTAIYYNDGEHTQDDMNAVKSAYKGLVEVFSNADTIFCSTLTPTTEDHAFYHTQAQAAMTFNETWNFAGWVTEWANEGLPVVLNDNYAALAGKEDMTISSDGLHPNDDGNALIAEQYAASIVNLYNADGTRKQATVNGQGYSTLVEALAAATAGQTVTLHNNVTVDNIAIAEGVTLDINGKTLTAEEIMVNGALVDGTQGAGLVAVDAGQLFINTNQENESNTNVLPLYDDEAMGYRLFNVAVNQKNHRVSTGKVEYGVSIVLGNGTYNEKAYKLLADGANADIMLKFNLLLNGETKLFYEVKRDTFVEYANAVMADSARYQNKVIVLAVYGIDSLDEGMTLACTPELFANAEVGGTNATVYGGAQTYQHSVNA